MLGVIIMPNGIWVAVKLGNAALDKVWFGPSKGQLWLVENMIFVERV